MLPIYRPALPRAGALQPYLERIDEARLYSNRGPLNGLLEERLSHLLTGRAETVVTASSGTAALQAAILAAAGRPGAARRLALMPGYTFSATAFAAQNAGYEPFFCDLAPGQWRLRPRDVLASEALPRAGLILPVAPFGERPEQAEWAAFQRETGIPVIIDAAASFEALCADKGCAGEVPVTLSLHATKPFSTGEGGAIVWASRDGLVRAVQAMNFGMIFTRESRAAGFNGKLSEYHAAIGLAGLDGLDDTRARRRATQAAYRQAARDFALEDRLILPPAIASCYALFRAASAAQAQAAIRTLTAHGIETRHWYGKAGVQAEAYFAATRLAPLPETEDIAARIIGIPAADDMSADDARRIMQALSRSLSYG